MALAECVFDVTDGFSSRDRVDLGGQMRRAAVSIPSNIAEGSRHPRLAYIHFLRIALGSHAELDTQCELATRRNLISTKTRTDLVERLEEVARLTYGLKRSLQRAPRPGPNP